MISFNLVHFISFVPFALLLLLHASARPVDGDVVVGVTRGPLRPLVLGQVVRLVLYAQGDAGGCEGEESEAGVAGTRGSRTC